MRQQHRPSAAIVPGILTCLVIFGLVNAFPADTKTITIKAVFRYTAPDGTVKPVRYAYTELRDSDVISDDVIARSYTESDGSVTFQYDSEMSDGWLGGRIDPYVRCYPKLYMPSYDMSSASGQTEWTYLARVGRGTGFAFVEPSYATIDTPTWSENDSDRTAEQTATGEAAGTFFVLDCALTANLPTSSENHRSPMALGDLWCFPGAAFDTGLPKTAYAPDTEVIFLDINALEFDATLHEYGHREMCRYYGSTFGNYDCTRGNHSFEEPLKNKWYLPSDAEWSAWAEGWADFCPVITKRQPLYRGAYDVETVAGANLASSSGSCEGTVCRIFWDIADTWQDKALDDDKKVIDRPLFGGMPLDDDPFGFTDRPPYSSLPGLDALKDIIRRDNPKSIWRFRDAWRTKFSSNRSALRALDAVFWINGLLRGRGELQENPPSCALSISGATTPVMVNGKVRAAYTGDVTLTADVLDLDPDDRPFLHVYFYWAYPSVAPGMEGSIPERASWKPIGVDVDGSNGFSVVWPKGKDRPLSGKAVCLIAVASDFMQESATTLRFDPLNRTGGQIWDVVFGEAAAGGGTGAGKLSGPLTEVGYFGGIGTALGIRVHRDRLYIAGWGQGLLIVDISTPESPRLISQFRPADIVRNDNSRDVDIYEPAGPSGGGRIYAIIAYGSAGMRIVDVTDSAKPFQVGGIGAGGMYPTRVRVVGSHAIFWGTGKHVVDISDPKRPGPAVPWLHTTMLVNRHEVTDMAIAGDDVYLACFERGLTILSLADILALKTSDSAKGREDEQVRMIRGEYTTGHRLIALDILETKTQGRRLAMGLYLFEPGAAQKSPGAWKYRLTALDVTEPGNIKDVGGIDLEDFPDDVAVDGSDVFVGHSRGVSLFDFADPAAPKEVCRFKGSAVYSGGEMAFYKDYLIVLVAHDHIGVLKRNR